MQWCAPPARQQAGKLVVVAAGRPREAKITNSNVLATTRSIANPVIIYRCTECAEPTEVTGSFLLQAHAPPDSE